MATFIIINTIGQYKAGTKLSAQQGDNITGIQALGGVLVELPNASIEAAAAKAVAIYLRGGNADLASQIMQAAYTEQISPAPTPTPAAISVSTIADLTAYDISGLDAGVTAYVQSVDDLYQLFLIGGLTVNSTSVVPANDGGAGVAQWKRLCIPSPKWLEQSEWYVDSNSGDDEASGLSGFPIASFAELVRRVGYEYRPANETSIYIIGDLPANDPISISHVAFDDGFATVQNQLRIFGQFVSFDSGTVTASTSSAGATNTQGQVTIDNFILAGEGLSFMRNANTGAFAPVMDTGSGNASFQNLWIAEAPGVGGSGANAANPSIGHVIEAGAFSNCFVGTVKSTMEGGVALYRLLVTLSGSIESSYLVNCVTFYGQIRRCTIQSCYNFAAILNVCSIAGGMTTGSCTTTDGGISFNTSCRLGSVDGTVGFVFKGGVSNVVGNAIIPSGAAYSIEIENASLVLETSNCLYGGSSPIKLRSGAVLRRRQATGVNPNKSGTAVVWDTADNPFRITGATPTFTQLTTNTWDATSGYGAAANTNIQHLQSSARIITSALLLSCVSFGLFSRRKTSGRPMWPLRLENQRKTA